MRELRKRIWIDPFQTGLLLRIAFCCLIFQGATWAFFSLCDVIDDAIGTASTERHSFASAAVRSVLALIIVVPPLVVDSVRFAHRLVGPLYRFRKTIQAITAGEPVSLITLRKGDMLMDFRDDFNQMLLHLQQQGLVVLKSPPGSEPSKTPQLANTAAS
jgi:hypothetical protein